MKKRVISILTVLFLIVGLLWHENYATASERVTITYVMDGNTVVTQEVEIGSTASTPTVTAPDGYFISGYQLSDGSAVSADMVYTSDTTVYIQLEPYSQTVAQDVTTPTPVETPAVTQTPVPTITENTDDENTATENGNDIAPAGVNISVFFVPETFSDGLLPALTDYTESVVVTANEQGTIFMPVIAVPQGLSLTGYVDALGNAVNGETVFLADTAIYAQYALAQITDLPDTTPVVTETPTESPLVTDAPEIVEEGQIPTEIVLEPELILHYVTIRYAGLVTRDGYTYYDYDDSYVYVCEVKENGTIDLPYLPSYADMTYVGLMDDYGNFVSADTVFTGDTTLYAVYDYGYSLMSLSVDGEEVTESATLSHVHGGSSTTGGTCYTEVYHVHGDACYTTGKLTAYRHGSGGHADAATNGCNANKTCRWISGGTCSVCGNVTYYFPCNQSKAVPKVGDVHCNKLTCTTSTTEIIGYNLNCTHADCGTVTMTSSNTQDNAPDTTLSINLVSSGAGATITAYNWSTGATTDSILVANNGDYICEVTYTDSVTGASATVTVGMNVSNIDSVPPTVSVTADTDAATKSSVYLTVSATDNVEVSSYSFDGVNYSNTTTYEVTANGTYTLYAKDLAGNVGTAQYVVSNIDKEAPDVTVSFDDRPTNSAVNVTVSATDRHSAGYDTAHGNSVTYSFNGASYCTKTQYSVTENGTYTVRVRDAVGNITEKSITVNGIDTKSPVISGVNSSNTAMTNQDITLTVLATDTQDSGYSKSTVLAYTMNGSAAQTSNQFTVTRNGTYNFTVSDPAGNKATYSITVSNIDKEAPQLSYSLLPDIGTNGVTDVRITATDNNGVTLITDGTTNKDVSGTDTTATFTYSQNGTYVFTARDVAGNESTLNVTVANIDTLAPAIDSLAVTNSAPQNVSVTIRAKVTEKYSNGYDSAAYGTDIFYSWNGGDFTKNATYTVAANGTYTLTVKDLLGNEATSSVTVSNFDNISPTITKTVYSPELPVRTQVWVDVFAQDEYPDGYTGAVGLEYSKDGITYQNDNYFTYTENGTYTVYVRDKAGNVSQCTHEVTTIDRTPPALTVSMSPDKATKGEVTLTVTATDAAGIGRIESVFGNKYGTLSMKTLSMDVTVTENGSYTFTSYDQPGNEVSVTYTVSNIDTENPVITALDADTTSPTNGSVTLIVSAEDTFSVGYDESAFGSSLSYRFDENAYGTGTSFTVTENGTYAVWVKDLVGNESSQSIAVSNIDTIAPTITGLVPDITEPTTENIVITVSASDTQSDGYTGAVGIEYSADGVTFVSGNTFEVPENGTYTYYVKDTAGNVTSESITISNIDREGPVLTYEIAPNTATNGSVVVTVTAQDNFGVYSMKDAVTEQISNTPAATTYLAEFTYDANGAYTIFAYDRAGNESSLAVEIKNIDTDAPVIDELVVVDTTPNNQSAVLRIQANEAHSSGYDVSAYGTDMMYVWQNGEFVRNATFTVCENGVYSVTVKDKAGNTITQTVSVDSVDKIAPSITSLVPDITEPTTENIVITVSASDTQSDGYAGAVDLTYSADGITYTGNNSFEVTENGAYTYYVKDTAGNVTSESITISNIDREAPVVTHTLSTSGAAPFVIITVHASDVSGVAKIVSETDTVHGEISDTVLTYALTADENKVYTFTITDHAGNSTDYDVMINNIDTEEPVIDEVRVPNGTPAKEITVEVVATDTQTVGFDSQLGSALSYKLNGGSYQSEAALRVKENGTYTLYVKDSAGNVVTHTFDVTCIDATPPSLSVTMEPDRWTNKPVVIKASATDTVSDGFSGNADLRCEFSFDGVTYSDTNSWTVQRNGTYTIYCRDSVGNVATCKVTVTQIKTEPIPSDTISVSSSTGDWSKDEIVVTIEVKDSSLAKENAYSFDGGSTWQSNNSFVVKENGTYTFCVRDVAGNVTKVPYTVEQIDKELPQAQVRMEGAYESANITLIVEAQDRVSGLADEAYSFDGGKTWQNDNTFVTNGEGWYIILVRDKAGNEFTLEAVLTSDMFMKPTAAPTRKVTATPSPTETPSPTPTPEPVSEVLPTVTVPTPVIMPSIVPDMTEQHTTPSIIEETQTITVEIEDQLAPKADRFNIFRIFTDFENMTPTERAVAISAYGVFVGLLVAAGVMLLLLRMRNVTVYYHDGKGTFVKCQKASLKQREGVHVVTVNDKHTERSVYRFVPCTRYLNKHRWEPVLITLNGKEYKRILEPDMTVDASKG